MQALHMTSDDNAEMEPYGIVQMRNAIGLTYSHLKIAHMSCYQVTTVGLDGLNVKANRIREEKANAVADTTLTSFLNVPEANPNILVVFEGHSDEVTGEVVHSNAGGYANMALISKLLEHNLNKLMWELLPTLTSLRGLLLTSCGGAIRSKQGREDLIQLVKSRRFTFVVAFANESNDSLKLAAFHNDLANMMSRPPLAHHQLWPTIHAPFFMKPLLRKTPVVFIFRQREDHEQVTVRMMYYTANSFWGWLDPVPCKDLTCKGILSAKTGDNGMVHAECPTCKASADLKAPEFVYDLGEGVATVPFPHPTDIAYHVKRVWK
ncbi:hypothetical protein BDW22DRAFT_1465495 [Trametopsis cervina]|nr:hypothetical protein BDW22DRAFT_1465495 [Trametopsis cervina]